MKNTSQKVKTDKILAVQACFLQFALMLLLCPHVTTLDLCYNFALVLHEKNALVFSQTDVHNFFTYIINLIISLTSQK